MEITLDVNVKGVTPEQAIKLAEFVRGLLRDEAVVIGNGEARVQVAEAAKPSPMQPVASPAPIAAPSSVPAPVATASADVDSRGVPYHPDFHAARTSDTGGKNPDGSWKKRRGHDKVALATYEAPYLGQTVAPMPGGVDPVAVFGQPVASGPAPLTVIANAEPVEVLESLWARLASANVVDGTHANYMQAAFGGHPVGSDHYRSDPAARQRAIDWLRGYLQYLPAGPAPIAA